jgi:hypothetical protein
MIFMADRVLPRKLSSPSIAFDIYLLKNSFARSIFLFHFGTTNIHHLTGYDMSLFVKLYMFKFLLFHGKYLSNMSKFDRNQKEKSEKLYAIMHDAGNVVQYQLFCDRRRNKSLKLLYSYL